MTALSLVSPLWWPGRAIVPVGLLGLIVLAVALALRATSTPAVRAKQGPMCDNCGQLLEADWQTCPYCGTELVATSILPRLTTLRLWMAALLALWLAGAVFVPRAAAQTGDSPHLTVVVEALNVREGPGMGYPIAGSLVRGDQVPMIGRHAASGWWQVQLPGNHIGWVTGGTSYVHISGDTAGVPEVAAPPLAAMSGTPAPIANPALTGTIVFQTVSGGPIYAINADGTNLRYLSSGLDPALSPDGEWVTFTRWEGEQEGVWGSLWIVNVDGSSERAIHGGVRQPKSPVWSPDGTQIAIAMQQGGWLEPKRICGPERPPQEVLQKPDEYDLEIIAEGRGQVKYCYTLPPNPFWGLRVVDVTTGDFEDLPRDTYSLSPTWDPVNDWRLVYDGDWTSTGGRPGR